MSPASHPPAPAGNGCVTPGLVGFVGSSGRSGATPCRDGMVVDQRASVVVGVLSVLLGACGGEPKKPTGDSDSGAPSCESLFQYVHPADAEPIDGVSVVGDWNGWDATAHPMVEVEPGTWEVYIPLSPGVYPYQLARVLEWSVDTDVSLFCDPGADEIHCPDGYKEPWETDWSHTCTAGTPSSCNSLRVVGDCELPTLYLESATPSASGDSLSLSLYTEAGDGGETTVELTLDGVEVPVTVDQTAVSLTLTDLSPGRHTVRAVARDAAGRESKAVWVPFWAGEDSREAFLEGSIYFAFVDRLANGDESLDSSEGVSLPIADYQGGDFAGVQAMLPYLDELGVKTLWISNPQDNVEGAWDGDCAETYAGYHAYWPDSARGVEEHFGDEAALHALVEAAHARGMRVIMDWVANHVHENHPYYLQHEADGWFNSLAVCKDWSGGQQNWDRIPESCWFAPYLPDIDYGNPEALDAMVEDALWWAETYDLDGLRVDAVKHMPHAVVWDLEQRIRSRVEHRHTNLGFEFWTVGETFDGTERVAAYISREGKPQLDGQFDFPLFFALDAVFAQGGGSMRDVAGALNAAAGSYGENALMSAFLGNHDVSRFVTKGAEGGTPACGDDGVVRSAGSPGDPWPYRRMKLGWTVIFSHTQVPLIYYGDELGMPGYTDPDNRQPLWWYTGAGIPGSMAEMDARLSGESREVLRHVAALGELRRNHPALHQGTTTEWWLDDDVYGFSRVDAESGDKVLVLVNRGAERTLSNGLGFAGLPSDGVFEDALSGERFVASGDSLSVYMGAVSSRILRPI